MHTNVAGFLDSFVQDEVMCRCLDEDDFGQPLDNEQNDIPLYDQFNRGLVATQRGLERTNLSLEGNQERPGLTGYIPSAEQGLAMGAKPKPRTLVLELGEPDENERAMSMKRRGLMR